VTGLSITQDAAADALLHQSPLALVLGMALDQQVPMEKAFSGPLLLQQRLGHLDASQIAAVPAEQFHAVMAGPPAVHRYPQSMGDRLQALCQHIADNYNGEAQAIWQNVDDSGELLRRIRALPGFGEQKAKIFLALLGKQLGVQPTGWRETAGPYGEAGATRSVADVTSRDTLLQVRAFKQQQKQGAKAAKAAG
jgi:uncharacterized HhH-GPD family protein